MNIVGPPLGKVALVPPNIPEANINQAIAVFRGATTLDSRWIACCLATEHLFEWALSRAKRTSTQLNLTLELCRDFPIPLPSEHERQQILSTLDGLNELGNGEKAYLQALFELRTSLRSSLLTGEIRVPLDPSPPK
jgi:type I restriction enzyme S subunit